MVRVERGKHKKTNAAADDGSSEVQPQHWNDDHNENGIDVQGNTASTLSSGAFTHSNTVHTIAAESGTADNLDTITATDSEPHDRIQLYADTGDIITVTNAGNINTATGTSIILSEKVPLVLYYDGTDWNEFNGKVAYFVAANDAPQSDKDRANYICDGTADEVQIQAAVDALPTAGGKVELSAGTFNMTDRIQISTGDEPLLLQGQGSRVTIIKPVAGFTAATVINNANGDDREFRDFKIDCSVQTGGTTDGITFLPGVQNCRVENVFITNTRSHGINIDESSIADKNIRIRDCEINLSGASGILVDLCRQVTISGCHIDTYAQVSTTNSGIKIRDCEDCVVDGNYVEGANADNTGEFGIIAQGNTTTSNNIVLSNNAVFNANSDGIVFNKANDCVMIGNTISGGKDVGIGCVNSNRITITGNNVKGTDVAGIVVSAVSGDGADIAVIGNTVDDIQAALQSGISIATTHPDTLRRISVVGNIISNATDYGIELQGNVDGIVVTANTITGSTTGDVGKTSIQAGNVDFQIFGNVGDDSSLDLLKLGRIEFADPTIVTEATTTITLTKTFHTIAAETGTTGTIDTIAGITTAGTIIILQADAGDTITLTGGGNIILNLSRGDFVMVGDNGDKWMGISDGTDYHEISASNN